MSEPATQLWLVDLDHTAEALQACEQAVPRLSPSDQARLDQITNPDIQRLRRAAYVAQRLILERLLGTAIRQANLPRDALGRPNLPAGHTGSFSLAHTGRFALIAASHAPRIGVDLESTRPIRMNQSRQAIIIAAAQALAVRPLPVEDEAARFLQAWTRLEALAKADGQGIGHLLTRIGAVGGKPPRPGAATELANTHALQVHDLTAGPALYAAIAQQSATPPPLQLFPATPEELPAFTQT